ncbi:MFS transporter [Paenibacillus glycanilyticus]|uniref:MFS transporter n=1 Tax=Paenibacillus glycanilyticus TaxID=126569 RepID=A0ABQ6GJS2_9BACL|nr:MFS transporter [Paenibacillus glycanilyticus]GLX70947.1 MFS transporter [Paenibacillus glycanilyticus]
MAETVTGQQITPFRRLVLALLIGNGGMMLALMVPAVMLLSFKMIEIDPDGYTSSYGLVAAIGAVFALIGNPLGGAFSDRTNNSFGRRRTWILIGPLVGSAAVLYIGFATEIWQVTIAWAIAQLFFNFGMAAYTALIPDQVPQEKQGTMSGIAGLVVIIGMSIGMVMMMILTSISSETKWTIVAVIGMVAPIVSLFLIKEGKIELPTVAKQQQTIGQRLSQVYPSPRKFPSFTWAIVSKFLLMMGYSSSLYLTVMLVNRMGFTEAEATASVGTINIISMLAMAATSIFGGVLSDRFGKQKPFLYGSALIMIVGIIAFAFIPQYSVYIVASAIIGLGGGCFTAVDMALVSRILPRKEDAAKDFGLMNVANALPQSIVPAIAPVLLAIGGWSFFYVFLALCVAAGVLALKPLPEVAKSAEQNEQKSITNKLIPGGKQA